MCKSVVHVSSDEKHLQAFITSALSTPSSSSEYDRAYIPPTPPPKKQKQKNKKTPNPWFNKQWNKNNNKNSVGLLQVYIPQLGFMSWIDSLKLLREDFKCQDRFSAYCFLRENQEGRT